MLFGPKLKYFKIEDLDYQKRYSRIFPIRPSRAANNSLFGKKHDYQCSSSPSAFKRISSPHGYSRNSEFLQKMRKVSRNEEPYELVTQWSPIINSLNTRSRELLSPFNSSPINVRSGPQLKSDVSLLPSLRLTTNPKRKGVKRQKKYL
jgi:hypothetical protein